MATLKELNLRIGSLVNTRKITQAMKLIATTKLNKFQSKIRFTINYHCRLDEIFRKVIDYVYRYPELLKESPLWASPRGNRVLILLFTSDRGLCGSFNSNVIKTAHQIALRFKEKKGKEIIFDCYGKKGYDFFKRRGFTLEVKHDSVFKEIYEEEVAAKFTKYYLDKFQNREFDELYLIYNTYVSTISQKPHVTRVLPFDLNLKPELQDEKSQKIRKEEKVDQHFTGLFEPDLKTFVNHLIAKFVQFDFYFAYLNSTTGEHAARMTSMDSATKNSTDMIDRLTLERNRVRQAAITKELIEIISGAESV